MSIETVEIVTPNGGLGIINKSDLTDEHVLWADHLKSLEEPKPKRPRRKRRTKAEIEADKNG